MASLRRTAEVPRRRVTRATSCVTDHPFTAWPVAPHFPNASCRGADVDAGWFFASKGDTEALTLARKVCSSCPHQLDCREFSLTLPSVVVGVYGGWSNRERTLERRARRRQLDVATASSNIAMVLASRPAGGDDEVIEELDQAVTSEPDASVTSDGTDELAIRTCAVCATELAPNRRKTCSASCAREHERRTRAARRSNGKPAVPSTRASHANGEMLTWPEPLAVLVGAGFEVRSIDVELDGQLWTLRRSQA